MENFKNNGIIKLDEKFNNGIYFMGTHMIQTYMDELNKCFTNEQDNFARICYLVYQIKHIFDDYNATYFGRVYTKKNESYTFDTIMQSYGFDKTQVSRLISVYNTFIELDNGKPKIMHFVADFSKSKLFELLAVDKAQIQKDIANNVLRPDMSVKLIRDYVNNYKALEKQNKKLSEEPKEQAEVETTIEEEIPPAYDPKKHYDFSYFESKSKLQLLNFIWELQKEYEKLKESQSKLTTKSKITTNKESKIKYGGGLSLNALFKN